ncbi:response regulator [Williamsia serinedens]|uniref:Transcriptional regulatory protein n=1 Tax=Williamsia serinedens TaxID=391736 RepID=A0ABT1GXS2_9NOCA|nr:response regulator [Williamsia serinedens]MCP2159549.1 Response regulator of citrate/malate metabolism [Williamsia serinedens]
MSDPIRVLIVEDEPLIAQTHEAYVERLDGFVVVGTAGTAQAALRAVARCAADDAPVDVVLLDIGLPDASGIELASALSGQRPEPDVIAITSERDLSVVRSAVAHGVLLYLLKPFTFAAFRDKLERYREYRAALPAGTDAVGQAEVDRAMAVLRGADERAAAPTGTAAATAEQIGRRVQDSDEGLTAGEAATAAGISRVTAWRYLERLADDGLLTRTTEYGRTGRPQVRYSWKARR